MFIFPLTEWIQMRVKSTGQISRKIILVTFEFRFCPSKVKDIADKILLEELKEQKAYDESESKVWSANISNRIRQSVAGCNLICLPPDSSSEFDLTESMRLTRYKVIVQTIIGQTTDQGFRFASRCLWNASFDNYMSTSFTNVRLFLTPNDLFTAIPRRKHYFVAFSSPDYTLTERKSDTFGFKL